MLLQARPQAIEIDPVRTALIAVDMQNDFGSKGGMFDRAGIDISEIQRAVAPTGRAIDAARKAGIPVIYLKMGFRGTFPTPVRRILRTGSNTRPCTLARRCERPTDRKAAF